MKQQKILILALILTSAFLIVGTGVVFGMGIMFKAPPISPGSDYDQEDLGFWGPMHQGGWGREADNEFHPMMTAMVDALTAVTDLTEDEIIAKLGEGGHLFDIAMDAGLSKEAYFEMMGDVREDVFSNGVDSWDDVYPPMHPFGGASETNENDGFIQPCYRLGGTGPSMDGYPYQGRGW